MRSLVERLRAVRPESLGRDLSQDILLRIRRRRRVRAWSVAFSGAAAAAACLALALLWRSPVVEEPPQLARAMDWLLSAQEPDGRWDAERWGGQAQYTVGLTGLATLALVGDGTHLKGRRAEAASRAVRYLCSQQGPSGRIGPRSGGLLYNHGIATVALLEFYGATGDTAVKGVLDGAIGYTIRSQGEAGGWGYGLDPGEPPNTAVTAWQVYSLLLAGSQGWEDARLPAGRGLAWLRSMMSPDGTVGYRSPGEHPYGTDALAAMAGFLLLAPGQPRDAALARLAELIVRSAAAPREGLDYYRDYFLSYAVYAASAGEEAGRLYGELRKCLEGLQTPSGSWEPADRWSLAGGRIYSTALAALSLQAETRAPRLIAELVSSAGVRN